MLAQKCDEYFPDTPKGVLGVGVLGVGCNYGEIARSLDTNGEENGQAGGAYDKLSIFSLTLVIKQPVSCHLLSIRCYSRG